MNAREFLKFLKLAERLKCNTRHSYTSSGRHESVAEHSWRLALMAMLARDEYPQLDMDKVIRMCLIHDLGEVVTGDIPAFEKTQADVAIEDRAVEREVAALLPERERAEFVALFAEMNALETPEARLYKAFDKLEALIQHNEADIATWLPLEYDLQQTYGTPECAFSDFTRELRAAVLEDSLDKIRDSK